MESVKPVEQEVRKLVRYSNRKIYDTTLSQYITMEIIVNFVLQGIKIEVYDNVAKKDITMDILTSAYSKMLKSKNSLTLSDMYTKIKQDITF